jgi:protein TonB
MANVETEHNNTALPQQEGGDTSASINLHEENLEALLSALSNSGTPPPALRQPAPQPIAAVPVAPVGTPVPSVAEVAAPVVKAEVKTEDAPVVQAAVAQVVERSDVQVVEPTVSAPGSQTAPSAVNSSPQQDMNSKLALLSSIKQRRAITVRPDVTEASTPVAEPVSKVQYEQPATSKGTTPIAEPTKLVPQARVSPTAPATNVRPETKPSLVAKKALNGPSVTPRQEDVGAAAGQVEQTRREESRRDAGPTEQKSVREQKARGDEPARREEAPQREVPAPALGRTSASTSSMFALADAAPAFSSLESQDTNQGADKLKGFLTSKAGMGVVGGAVLGGALLAFLLSGHGSKPANTKSTTTGIAQTSTAPTVVPSVTDGKASTAKSSSTTANNQQSNPSQGAAQTPKPGTAQVNAVQQQAAQQQAAQQLAAQQKPGVSPAATAQTPVQQQAPVAEANKPTARAFAAPTVASRPVSTAVIDAPPVIATSSAAPVAVGMPARIAPLPPPTAPAPAVVSTAASGTGQSGPITVAGKTQATRLVRQVVPLYPAVAKTARVQGTVRLRVTIGADGQVKGVTSLGGPLPLVQSATDAVKQWRYQPTIVDGKQVEVVTEVDLQFAL